MSDIVIVPAGNDRITICHWSEGGHWEALNVPHQALEGHDNHDMDVWPPVEGVTDGQNWPRGQSMYINDCTLTASATPTPEPSPSGTLPPTGANENMAVLAVVLIAAGAWMKWKSTKRKRAHV